METQKASSAETGFLTRASDLLLEYDAMARRDVRLGRVPPLRQAGLIPARNGKCPCGSDKKYKVCCRRAHPYVTANPSE